MRSYVLAVIAVAAISLACGLIGCWGNNPVDPPEPEPEPKDYLVWIRTYDKSTLYAYHTETGVIDTVDLSFEMRGADITVSHDGSLVYVPTGTSVMVLDVETNDIVNELAHSPKTQPVLVSPDGRYLVIPGDTLVVLSTSDYSVSFEAPDLWITGGFSSDSRTLYVGEGDVLDGKVGTLRRSDTGWTVHRNEFPGIIGLYGVFPIPDESKLLLQRPISWDATVLAVYDIALDSIVATDYRSPGNGIPAITPDGRYAYYGNPGTIMAGTPAPSELTQFDMRANRVIKKISTIHSIDSVTPDRMTIDRIAITPDGRWLVGTEMWGYACGLIKYDLIDEKFVDYHKFGTTVYGISTQLVP